MRPNFYVFSLYYYPDIDYGIFDTLLRSIAAVQVEEVRASFLFVDDLNAHHQECVGSSTTNRHGVAAYDFVTESGCDQQVVGPGQVLG